jgi:hypothetical protein
MVKVHRDPDHGRVKARGVWTAILVGVGMVAAACGTTAPGAGTAFCRHVVPLAADLRSNRSSTEVSFLTAHEAAVEDLRAQAPGPIRREVLTFLTGANAAIEHDNAALANTSAMTNASGRIKAFCGITG